MAWAQWQQHDRKSMHFVLLIEPAQMPRETVLPSAVKVSRGEERRDAYLGAETCPPASSHQPRLQVDVDLVDEVDRLFSAASSADRVRRRIRRRRLARGIPGP